MLALMLFGTTFKCQPSVQVYILLQTLRARLTTVEGKLVEKEFEIKRLMEENDSLKETVENLSRLTVGKSDGESDEYASQVYKRVSTNKGIMKIV